MSEKIKGIDVSEWQGVIDFKKVKESGIDFVMIRAGYGETNVDEYFEQNVYHAKANGLHVGCYYFVYATDVNSAINNADNFIRLLNRFKGKIDFPVACDFEYDSVDYMKQHGITPTKKLVCDITKAFCERVENAGYYTMLYSNYDYINQYYSELKDRFDLWLAYWNDDEPVDVNLWQYSSKGKVNGIKGNVDMDYCYTDFPKLIRTVGLNYLETIEPIKETILTLKVGDTFTVENIDNNKLVIAKNK